jgi:hypothetical protein
MMRMQPNALNISIAGVCPFPGTAITERAQVKGIASVASALDVAAPRWAHSDPATGPRTLRSLSADAPRSLRDIPQHSAIFIKLQKTPLFAIGHLPSPSRGWVGVIPFQHFRMSAFQHFCALDPRLSTPIHGQPRLSTPKINFKKIHDSQTQAPPVSAFQYFSFSAFASITQ